MSNRIHIERREKSIVLSTRSGIAHLNKGRVRGKPCWFVRVKVGEITRKTTKMSEEDAIKFAEDLLSPGLQPDTESLENMTPAELAELLLVRERTARAAAAMREKLRTPLMEEVVEMFKLSRKNKGCSERYLETIHYHLENFLRRFNVPINHLSVAAIDKWLLSSWPVARTRKNVRGTLCSLGEYCRAQGWLPYDRPTPFEATDNPIVRRKEHEIMFPDDFRKLLRQAAIMAPHFIPWLVLGGFCGLRAAERDRINWSLIDFDTKTIMLTTAITKTGRRRIVQIPDNAIAWLKKYRGQPLHWKEAACKNLQVWYIGIRQLHISAGVKKVPNGLRASCATYHLLQGEHAGRTSLQMGHSINELETTYYQPTLKCYAEEWFSIFPTPTHNDVSNVAKPTEPTNINATVKTEKQETDHAQ